MQCCCGGKGDSDRLVMHKFMYCDRCCRTCANHTTELSQRDTLEAKPVYWMAIACCLPCLAGASQGEQLRVQLGRAIRQLKVNWRLAVLLVPLLQLPAATPLGVEPGSSDIAANTPAAGSSGSEQGAEAATSVGVLQQQEAAVQLLLSAAKGFGLEDCWQWKPLLDGKQVRTALLETRYPV